MWKAPHAQAPSSSLPPWPKLKSLTECEVLALLQGLSDIYCPLAFQEATESLKHDKEAINPAVDSGYASGADDGDDDEGSTELDIAALRIDPFERRFSERWLTSFIARASSLPCFDSDETCQRAVDQASCVLEAFTMRAAEQNEADEEDCQTYTRDFSFQLALASEEPRAFESIHVQLNDGLAGTNSHDPHDVGLQSWGASIATSALLCKSPARFGLTQSSLGCLLRPRIIELGAGTGLISLVLAKMLPFLGLGHATLITTDYHQAVLANLRSNIARNFPGPGPLPIETSFLDWSAPSQEPPLNVGADMLIATDVVYAREHALWLRDCASRLLKPEATFWMVATVRPNGVFEGLMKTVESAFSAEDAPEDRLGRKLRILHMEDLEKRPGTGRGDESGYRMFRIGWAN